MMMDGAEFLGPWVIGHWLVFALLVAAVAWPVGRILGRIGFSPFWAVLVFVPVVNLIGLWAVALSPWQGESAKD